MIDVRCKGCNKLLAKAHLMDGAIKCHGCNGVFEYKVFNNMFVTSSYDPTLERVLRIKNVSANMTLESSETEPSPQGKV